MGDPAKDGPRQQGPFTLPSIATMTQGITKSPEGSTKPKSAQQTQADMMRDSGMWSMQSPSKLRSEILPELEEESPTRELPSGEMLLPLTYQPVPKRSSYTYDLTADSSTISSATGLSTASSNTGLHLQTILNANDSHRFSVGSAGTPSTRYSREPINSQANAHENNRSSVDANYTSFLDSRRSSVDSKVGISLGSLNVNHQSQSPFEGSNTSQVSLSQSSFASSSYQQPPRTMAPPIPPPKKTSHANLRRPATAGGQPPRRAPPISANPRAGVPNPMAADPTPGYAWAFPDHVDKAEHKRSITPESSRQGSLAASSINTLESGNWISRQQDNQGSSPPMQHKIITELQQDDLAQLGSGNYSRTPELRVSHKLAERKRRSEMKDLFDSLNRILPNAAGNKASKWEVLSKSVDFIAGLKHAYETSQRDIENLRQELDRSRTAMDENHALQNEMTAMYQQLCRVDPNGHHVFGPRSQFLDSQGSQTPSRIAPSFGGGTGAMQGVEYGHGGSYDRH